ncbi:MAG: hypothetical protein M1825_005179 [Sarcosagium campestre]|nr:MAG: hypothetical protein M1825_005179 [Sarcosagium campestre]
MLIAGNARLFPYRRYVPRPSVPRLRYLFGVLLRGLGLRILVSLVHRFRRRPKHEYKKIAIDSSIWPALLRTSGHILPSSVAIALIVINLKGLFIGSELDGHLADDNTKLALLQVAAKTLELLINGSLATIIFHAVRQELAFGDGVPLGLVTSGLSCAQLSHLWSPELWSSMSKSAVRNWAIWRIIVLVIASIIIGTLSGPSSAILMIPAKKSWWAYGTSFFMKGSQDDLWPSRLTAQHLGGPNCGNASGLNDFKCINGGYTALYNHALSLRFPSQGRPSGPYSLLLLDQATKQVIHGGTRSRGVSRDTWAVGTHAATAWVGLKLVEQRWRTRGPLPTGGRFKRFLNAHRDGVYVKGPLPTARTSCSPMREYDASDSSLPFPVIPQQGYWSPEVTELKLVDGTTKGFELEKSFGEIWDSFRMGDERYDSRNDASMRTQWVSLPPEFGPVTTGIVVFGPSKDNSTARLGAGCSIDARWAEGISWGVWEFYDGACSSLLKGAGLPSAENIFNQDFKPSDSGDWRSISADPEWIQAVAPRINPNVGSSDDRSSCTTLENFLNAADFNMDDRYADLPEVMPYLEYMLSIFMTDVLSRVGHAKQWEGDPDSLYYFTADNGTQMKRFGDAVLEPHEPGFSYSKLSMSVRVNGYVMYARSAVELGAVAVLAAYLLIALTHTLSVLFWDKRTSGAWDTASELLALSQNSRPAPRALADTCAGVRHLGTLSQKARIVVVTGTATTDRAATDATANATAAVSSSDDDDDARYDEAGKGAGGRCAGGGTEQLELIFDADRGDDPIVRLEPDKAYGAL